MNSQPKRGSELTPSSESTSPAESSPESRAQAKSTATPPSPPPSSPPPAAGERGQGAPEQADVVAGLSGTGVGVVTLARLGPRRVEYSEVNGIAMLEGDIELGHPGELNGSDKMIAEVAGELHAAVVTDASKLWPLGRVPYEPLPGDSPIRAKVIAAMEAIERHARIEFVERTPDDMDYLVFEVAPFSSSRVGRAGGRQVVRLSLDASVGTAMHELCHALGLWHEQSRKDRDQYIEIQWDHVLPGYEHNFRQQISDADDFGPYDFDSIMHYPPLAYSKDGQPTIKAVSGNPNFGQRERLSAGDINALRHLYGAPAEPPARPPVGGQRPGIEVAPREGVQFRVTIAPGDVARVVTTDWPSERVVHWDVICVSGPVSTGPLLSWDRSVGRSASGGVDHYFTIRNLSDASIVAEARYVVVGLR